MELFRSLETKTKLFTDPFKHFEINEPLTQNAIDEICSADIADPRKQNLNYDGTRALDGGEGAFRAGHAGRSGCNAPERAGDCGPRLCRLARGCAARTGRDRE